MFIVSLHKIESAGYSKVETITSFSLKVNVLAIKHMGMKRLVFGMFKSFIIV